MRVAVVDLGTNSTRLLVAQVEDGRIEELERASSVTRLGELVDSTGRLQDPAMERVYDATGSYRRSIDHLGAERVVALATSAVRDADNGEHFHAQLRDRFGLDPRTITGDEEARLTFLGATSDRGRSEGTVLVVDVGGGSTELVAGEPDALPNFHVSTRAGSVRQTERHLDVDPPEAEQLDELAQEVRTIIGDAVPAAVRAGVKSGIAVAGTATSLAAIDQQLDPVDPARIHGYPLTLEACERMLTGLAGMPLDERRRVTGLHPDRAPTIVAGAVILVESMHLFGLRSIDTSEADLLHGAALEAAADNA